MLTMQAKGLDSFNLPRPVDRRLHEARFVQHGAAADDFDLENVSSNSGLRCGLAALVTVHSHTALRGAERLLPWQG